jgi:hypothetical protein
MMIKLEHAEHAAMQAVGVQARVRFVRALPCRPDPTSY